MPKERGQQRSARSPLAPQIGRLDVELDAEFNLIERLLISMGSTCALKRPENKQIHDPETGDWSKEWKAYFARLRFCVGELNIAPGGFVIGPPAAQIIMAGLAPSITPDQLIAAPSGAMEIAGLAPVLQVDQLIAAPAGALEIAGQVPTVQTAGAPTDTGFVIAGAGATVDTTARNAWSNPGNITADDGTNATYSPGASSGEGDDLKASDFGLAIPGGATIDGIEVRAQLSGTGTSPTWSYANVGKDDSTLATSNNPGDTLTSTPTNFDDGGAADLWGLSWTPAEINASTFQVRIRCTQSAFSTASCDAIWVKVYYTP
jgi:hypothetical protein